MRRERPVERGSAERAGTRQQRHRDWRAGWACRSAAGAAKAARAGVDARRSTALSRARSLESQLKAGPAMARCSSALRAAWLRRWLHRFVSLPRQGEGESRRPSLARRGSALRGSDPACYALLSSSLSAPYPSMRASGGWCWTRASGEADSLSRPSRAASRGLQPSSIRLGCFPTPLRV